MVLRTQIAIYANAYILQKLKEANKTEAKQRYAKVWYRASMATLSSPWHHANDETA